MIRTMAIVMATTVLLSALPTSDGLDAELERPVDEAVEDEETDEELLEFFAEAKPQNKGRWQAQCKSCSISCTFGPCSTLDCCPIFARCYCDLGFPRCECG